MKVSRDGTKNGETKKIILTNNKLEMKEKLEIGRNLVESDLSSYLHHSRSLVQPGARIFPAKRNIIILLTGGATSLSIQPGTMTMY